MKRLSREQREQLERLRPILEKLRIQLRREMDERSLLDARTQAHITDAVRRNSHHSNRRSRR